MKEVQLSQLLSSDEMSKIGWLEAVRTLFSSIITPTLTYGCQSYVEMNKRQEAEIETAHKNILYKMLRISKYTQYAAVLLELNMVKIKHIINQLKICFIRDLIHKKGRGFCLEILREEEKLFPGTGQLAEIRRLCEYYGLGDVVEEDIETEYIKKKILEVGRAEIWKDTLTNRRIPVNINHLKCVKPYMRLPRYQSKLFFAYRTGELEMLDYRRGEFGRRFGNTKCFACSSHPDRLDHVMQCEGYPADLRCNLKDFDFDPYKQKEFIEYLTRLDLYRSRAFSLPLLFRPSTKKKIEKRLEAED